MARRDTRSVQQRKDAKADYDEAYRAANHYMLKAKKAAYYVATIDREKERLSRQKRMPQHVEYCRQPEYRAQKAIYDRQYRAKKDYGPFADAGLMLLELQGEIESRATWHERAAAKGTVNKSKQRKREYGQRSIKETVRSQPQGRIVGDATVDQDGINPARRR